MIVSLDFFHILRVLRFCLNYVLLLGVGCNGFYHEGKDRACNSTQAFDS